MVASKLFYLRQFQSNDLRYYLAVDQYNNSPKNRYGIFFGVLLTIASASVGVYVAIWNDVSNGIISSFTFVGVNCFTLFTLAYSTYPVLSELSIPEMDKILVQVSEKSFGNLYGCLINRFIFYKDIEEALLNWKLNGDVKSISKVGDPQKLEALFATLLINKKEIEFSRF